jgi:hypothetical protein
MDGSTWRKTRNAANDDIRDSVCVNPFYAITFVGFTIGHVESDVEIRAHRREKKRRGRAICAVKSDE